VPLLLECKGLGVESEVKVKVEVEVEVGEWMGKVGQDIYE
jgi:hypothetical protein